MSAEGCDPLRHIAEQVADCFAESGYAFVEDDKVEGLAALRGLFLTTAGIRANPPSAGDPRPDNDLSIIGSIIGQTVSAPAHPARLTKRTM